MATPKTSTIITTQAYHSDPSPTSPSSTAGPSNHTVNNIHDEETPPQTAFSILEPPAHLSAITTHTTHLRPSEPEETFPDGGARSWLVVLGSFFLLMASYGMMNSTGVLQNYFATHQLSTYSTSAVGWIPGAFTFFGLVLSVQIGPMFDRYGPRGILIAGSACYVSGMLILAECRLYWHFMLTFGVVMGSGAALLSTAAMAAVPQWFDRRVGLAIGWAMSGAGLGGVMFPLVLRKAFVEFGYRWAIRMLAFMVAGMCGVGIALVRSRLPKGRSRSSINLRAFRDTRFTWLTLGTFGE
jgi:MFS family permease